MARQRKYTSEQIILKLREADVLLSQGKKVKEAWRQHYNTVRPHRSLDYKPPAPAAVLPLASQNLQVALSQNVVQL